MDRHDIVHAFFNSRLAKGCTPSTLAFYEWCVGKLDEGPLPTRPEQIEDILAAAHLAPESRFDLWRGLKTFFRWSSARYDFPNPMKVVERPKVRHQLPKYLSDQQLEQLWEQCETPRQAALVTLILDTGLRIGEVASLQKSSLAQDPPRCRVSGKVGVREVPLTPQVLDMLLNLGDEQFIWVGRWGPMVGSGLGQLVDKLMAAIGVQGGPHLLRHTFAVHYLKGGGDIVSLQRLMGHSSIESTRIYLELLEEDVRAQHRRFSPAARLLSNGWKAKTVDPVPIAR